MRALALALDLVPAFGPVAVVGAVAAVWFDGDSGASTDLEPAAGIAVLLSALWPAFYFGRARTWGKSRRGTWVVGAGRRRAWLRGVWALLPTASFAWPFLAPLLVADTLWLLIDRRRALHDRLAGTEVLREVPEAPWIRQLRAAGAGGRRAYAQAALEWARPRSRRRGARRGAACVRSGIRRSVRGTGRMVASH